jgi:hypothetical protein
MSRDDERRRGGLEQFQRLYCLRCSPYGRPDVRQIGLEHLSGVAVVVDHQEGQPL